MFLGIVHCMDGTRKKSDTLDLILPVFLEEENSSLYASRSTVIRISDLHRLTVRMRFMYNKQNFATCLLLFDFYLASCSILLSNKIRSSETS